MQPWKFYWEKSSKELLRWIFREQILYKQQWKLQRILASLTGAKNQTIEIVKWFKSLSAEIEDFVCMVITAKQLSKHLNMRVWSWLRMNAGGVLNTCKSNGLYMKPSDYKVSGGRVSNAWITCLILGDNSWKRLLIPHKRTVPHGTVWKTPVV